MPYIPRRRPLATLAVLAALAGCAPRAEPIFGTGPNGERTIQLEVSNRNFSDATVYAVRYSDRLRAGVVTGMGRSTFRVPWATSAPLQVEIRLTGGDRCITREVSADPGDRISVEIPQDLRSDPDCSAP